MFTPAKFNPRLLRVDYLARPGDGQMIELFAMPTV
jgi:hypothetical protein